jgi:predicted RNA-binding Zn-ribbon protein involved in translation (DUF1610 family)
MLCPKGHESEDSDFCSVCGAKIVAPAAPAAKCPDCGIPRQTEQSVFCEDCGYNYTSGAHGEPAPALIPDSPPPVLTEWEVAVSIDPSLKTAESPDPPADFHPSTMMLMGDSYLIGRRSDKRGVFPEISLDADDAVSHRHALLNRTPEGGIVLRDVGSSNGTQLNGADVTPLTDMPLKDGDVVTVGHWTRIALRRVS